MARPAWKTKGNYVAVELPGVRCRPWKGCPGPQPSPISPCAIGKHGQWHPRSNGRIGPLGDVTQLGTLIYRGRGLRKLRPRRGPNTASAYSSTCSGVSQYCSYTPSCGRFAAGCHKSRTGCRRAVSGSARGSADTRCRPPRRCWSDGGAGTSGCCRNPSRFPACQWPGRNSGSNAPGNACRQCFRHGVFRHGASRLPRVRPAFASTVVERSESNAPRLTNPGRSAKVGIAPGRSAKGARHTRPVLPTEQAPRRDASPPAASEGHEGRRCCGRQLACFSPQRRISGTNLRRGGPV